MSAGAGVVQVADEVAPLEAVSLRHSEAYYHSVQERLFLVVLARRSPWYVPTGDARRRVNLAWRMAGVGVRLANPFFSPG